MDLVAPLISGIRGAENGTATVYVRGTVSRATWYPDFEANSSSQADVSLDSNGGAEVYVGQLVDVSVKTSGGVELRRFTAGHHAAAVEVISDSFTGTDYTTGQTGANKPTTVAAVLDLWNNSAGSTNFNVLVGGSAKTLQSALSGSALFFNVKDAAYGATGDGTTDDTSAIQAAINAASAAGGGTVFFPSGTYRHTAVLTVPATVCLLGVGPEGSTLLLDHASANSISISTSSTRPYLRISNLEITVNQANSGVRITTSGVAYALLDNCYVGHATHQDGDLFSGTVDLRVVSCWLVLGGPSARVYNGSGSYLTISGSEVFGPSSVAYSPTNGVIAMGATGAVNLVDTLFICTPSSGAYTWVAFTASSAEGRILGCEFVGSASATVTAMSFHASGVGDFVESGNVFSSTITAYSYTASTMASGALQSRRQRRTNPTVAGNTTLDSGQFGTITAAITVNSAVVLTLNDAPKGERFTLILDNDFAGTTGNITFSANVRTLGTETLASGEVDIYEFISESVDGTLQWLLLAASRAL